jgi:signal peptidase II
VAAVAVFGLDRVSKGLVAAWVAPGSQHAVLPGVWITNTQNSGAAFSIAPNATLFFLLASVVVGAGLVVYVARHQVGLGTAVLLGMILGGDVGNGYDRLVHGTVTDFIDLHWWPVFNIADSAITVGVLLLVLGYFRRPRAA